jgi:hypothetical protein
MKTKITLGRIITWTRTQLHTSEPARHVATALVAFILGAWLL